ncbi:phospholipase D-like domain-containing protein DpdK [Corallincola platygyrae]|uniref:Phospholipase D-like domain-containing protein DpdK n=1 Tax=Corallincola platygyrae TaxID=1193278 RepID=A0ABW4XIQ6_9GAMM
MTKQRQIFLHGPLGQRHLREVLGSQLVALMLRPEPIWLVSPWISDFSLLDNRAGLWDAVEPDWGSREISFLEMLACITNAGCELNLVTRDEPMNRKFISQLKHRLAPDAVLRHSFDEQVHTKGLLSARFFLKGSMNFTFSGTNRNDEHLFLITDPDIISEARIEFNGQYAFGQEETVD